MFWKVFHRLFLLGQVKYVSGNVFFFFLKLRNAGGLGPLIELLHTKNKEVRRNACWAVMVCASDELTAIELCRLG